MKQLLKYRLLLGLLIFVAFVSIVPPKALAVTGTVYFTPAGGDVKMGQDFTVEVRGDVPDPGFWGGGGTIVVNYDASKLQVIDQNDSGGAFRAANSRNFDGTGAGVVRYTAYVAINAPGVNNTKIISITFRPLTTGSSVLSFGSGTNVNNGPTSGASKTFTVQPINCPAGQIGTPPNCTTPPPPVTPPTPTKPTTPSKPSTPAPTVPTPTPSPAPVIEETPAPTVESDGGLKIENVKTTATRQKNGVSWTLNQSDITPTVTYGLSKSATTKAEAEKNEDNSFEAEFASLKPGTLYYFTIKAASSDNLQGATYSGTLTTRGYPVQLTIQQSGVLAPGAKVTLGSRSFVANKNAIISTELSEGVMKATIRPAGSTISYPVSFTVAKKTIPSSGNPELQSFTLNAVIDGSGDAENDNLLLAVFGVIGGIAAIVGGVIGFLFYKRRKEEEQQNIDAVDQDLLLANYGEALESYRTDTTNTPTPNLDAVSAYTAPIEQPEQQISSIDVPVEGVETLASAQESAEVMQTQEFAQSVPPQFTEERVFEPTVLPLPPEESTLSAGTETTQQYTEEEQTAAELVQIESVAVPESEEPSAIYDASTGELDIIHHQHSAPPPASPPVVATTSQQAG